MKIKTYTSALAILVALSACNSSNDTAAPAVPDPTPPVTEPTGPVAKEGTTATFDNEATDRTKSLTRSSGFRVAAQADAAVVKPQVDALADANKAQSDAEALRARLAALPNLNTANLVAEANAIIADFNALPGTTEVVDPVALDDPLAPAVASAQAVIDGDLMDVITDSEKALAVAYAQNADTDGGFGEITLADGTVLQTASIGNVQADASNAFVSSRLVAAYEEDAQGRITRVAFVEASGTDFVANDAMGTYEADGISAFAVKVDGGFFNTLAGGSNVTINLATESGNVQAFANGASGEMFYGSDVVFDPATGAFTASNGELVYTAFPSTGGSTGSETVTANNAEILGQLHGDMKNKDFGADYTGIITSTTDRMEVIGGVIGTQDDPSNDNIQ